MDVSEGITINGNVILQSQLQTANVMEESDPGRSYRKAARLFTRLFQRPQERNGDRGRGDRLKQRGYYSLFRWLEGRIPIFSRYFVIVLRWTSNPAALSRSSILASLRGFALFSSEMIFWIRP
jgi:hypothetical protein